MTTLLPFNPATMTPAQGNLDQRVKAGATILTEQDGVKREVIFR